MSSHPFRLAQNSFGNLLFLAGFDFLGHFEGLNEGFLGLSYSMNLLEDTFPTSYRAPQTEIVCQNYALEKLIHQTNQNEVHKTVGFSSFEVRVLYFTYVKNAFGASL